MYTSIKPGPCTDLSINLACVYKTCALLYLKKGNRGVEGGGCTGGKGWDTKHSREVYGIYFVLV